MDLRGPLPADSSRNGKAVNGRPSRAPRVGGTPVVEGVHPPSVTEGKEESRKASLFRVPWLPYVEVDVPPRITGAGGGGCSSSCRSVGPLAVGGRYIKMNVKAGPSPPGAGTWTRARTAQPSTIVACWITFIG